MTSVTDDSARSNKITHVSVPFHHHRATKTQLPSASKYLVKSFRHWLPFSESVTTVWRHTHPFTHPFNGPFSGTTQVSRYQKGKTNLNFTGATDSEWQRHQLGCMQVCTSLQTDNHASTPPLKFFTGRMPFLPPNQQRQSTKGWNSMKTASKILHIKMKKLIQVPNSLTKLRTTNDGYIKLIT